LLPQQHVSSLCEFSFRTDWKSEREREKKTHKILRWFLIHIKVTSKVCLQRQVNAKLLCSVCSTKNCIRHTTARQSCRVCCFPNIINLLSNCHNFICGVRLCAGAQTLHGSCFTQKSVRSQISITWNILGFLLPNVTAQANVSVWSSKARRNGDSHFYSATINNFYFVTL
jgi:hypothetical protein